MEAGKIKAGQAYAWTSSPKSRYNLRKVVVIQALALSVPSYGKYREESEWRKQHGASRCDTYKGKTHYLVQVEGSSDKYICSSLNLVSTWADYEALDAKARQARLEREAAVKAATERFDRLVSNLESLGFDDADLMRYGATGRIVVDQDLLETLIANAMGGDV